jgi:CRP-like cAMP-binding protein
MVGVSVFMGGNTTPSRAIVQSAGLSYRVRVSRFASLLEQDIAPQRVLLRYMQSLLTQMALTAVCNRHHNLHQQFCRWLLLSLDRLPGNELIMTQELIANMLGVRRQGVTAAASKLQAQGAITYHRGRITVLDRSKLERCSCECYQVVARECARLMSKAQ